MTVCPSPPTSLPGDLLPTDSQPNDLSLIDLLLADSLTTDSPSPAPQLICGLDLCDWFWQVLVGRLPPGPRDGGSGLTVVPGADLRALHGPVCGVCQDHRAV